MKKVTQNATNAFHRSSEGKFGNTRIEVENGVTKMFLHGNLIAKSSAEGTFITNAGYSTNVTKERLNGLEGVYIHQKNWAWYLNGKEWDGSWIKVTA